MRHRFHVAIAATAALALGTATFTLTEAGRTSPDLSVRI